MTDYELYHASTRKHKYIKKIGNRYFYTQQEIAAYLKAKKGDVTFEKNEVPDYRSGDGGKMKEYRIDFNKVDGGHKKGGWSDGIGVRVGNKRIEAYNTTNKKYEKNPDVKGDNRGRFRREYAEDGATYTLDYSDKKTYRKRQRTEIQRKKNNIDFLKSHGVDTTEHEADLKRAEADYNRGKKRKKAAKRTISSMKKQAARGKKALSKFYKNNVNPGVTVTYDEAKIK